MKDPKTFHGTEAEKRASALTTMTYVTMSIANAYLEETKEILQEYGRYTFDTKHECEMAIKAFDRYHDAMKVFFKGEPLAQEQLCNVYEIIKEALDSQVLESIAQYNRKQETENIPQQ